MRLAIIGSRDIMTNKDNVYRAIHAISEIEKEQNIFIDTIVSGGATGGDRIGRIIANRLGYKLIEFFPDWKEFGKTAGVIRNRDIEKNADVCLALLSKPLKESRGTYNCVSLFEKSNKPIYFVEEMACVEDYYNERHLCE